jgi:hypothetical protein
LEFGLSSFQRQLQWLQGRTVTAYSSLLDFKNAAVQSCKTFGLSFTGAQAVGQDFKVAYRAEAATQSDYGHSALNYTASYYVGELGVAGKPGALAVGYEILGSEGA